MLLVSPFIFRQEQDLYWLANTDARVAVGERLTLTVNGTEQTVTVGGILTDHPLARTAGTETLFCSEKTFTRLTGENGPDPRSVSRPL